MARIPIGSAAVGVIAVACLAAQSAHMGAQDPSTSPRPAFEAASVKLQFTPDVSVSAPPGAQPPGPDADRPSLFTAVQGQLGLKLESTTTPMEVLVIDRVERPTAD